MAAYRVIVKPSADKALQKLPLDVQRRIVASLRELSVSPRPAGVVKMTGADNLWRIRVGTYRIVYEIQDARLIVLVVRIGDRKDIYR